MKGMLAEINSLPALIREMVPQLDEAVRRALDHDFCLSVKRLYLAGCGDSHHVGLNVELAFEALAEVPTQAMTALQFARYTAPHLPDTGPKTQVVVGTSVSGEVARTLEALKLGKQAGASTVALTATPESRVAKSAERVVLSTTPPSPAGSEGPIPGVRSFTANQLAFYLMAVRLGEVRGTLTSPEAASLREELSGLGEAATAVIRACEGPAAELAKSWKEAGAFIFAGGGPNYGIALFSAAKVLEATGDHAMGQDLEEWAHLQYFGRAEFTPTFLITAAERDRSRALEVALAAKRIGRPLAVISPPGANDLVEHADGALPLAEGLREIFSPVLAAIPGELFAAHLSEVTGEPYFRAFGGGRSVEAGGGISRIRTSEILEQLPR